MPIVGEDLLRAFLQIVLFTVFLLQAVSEKTLCTKGFTSNLIFLHENNCNYNSCRFSNNFAFILVFPLLQTKTRTSSQQVVWYLEIFLIFELCFKAMRNSIDLYKGTFLHVIPVCIMVPLFIYIFINHHMMITITLLIAVSIYCYLITVYTNSYQ